MPAAVRILEVARVAVPDTAALPPEPLRLCALDALWVTFPLIQRVFIFVDGVPPFASAVADLRASLAAAAARFLPLGGRLVHLPATGDVAIDCAGGGVRLVVAACDDADAARLAGDADHDAEALARLVPVLDAGKLPAETMAAQVTRLRGGLAVGLAMHHAVVDGRSVWMFLEEWAAACRGGGGGAAAAEPTFDRAAIKIPGGEELARSVLRMYAPDLPVATLAEFLVQPDLSRRTFTVSEQELRLLKQRIADLSPAGAHSGTSSFVAVAALAWVSSVRAKHPDVISPGDEVYLFFFADCRACLDPPPGPGYFGTCISGRLARATARDLLAADGLAAAAAVVREEVRRAAEEPLASWDWMDAVSGIALDRLVNVNGSTRFPAYEAADFGWGPPARTELVSMHNDGQVVLVAGKKRDGVQASVALRPAYMDAYKSHFHSYLG